MKIQKFKILIFSLFTISYSLFTATNSYAMHISEGILPFNWAVLWFAIAIPFVAFGLYKLKRLSAIDLSFKPLVGLLTAVVFIISCLPIPVPIAGTCSHPCGTGISAILLGPAISILISAGALLIQALFLAHGGLSTWGANIVSMGVMASFTGFLIFKALRSIGINIAIAGFFAGVFADWVTYLTTSVELALGIKGDAPFIPLFIKIFIAFIPTQLPIGILEGAMTAGMVVLLYKKKPELLTKLGVIKAEQTQKTEDRRQNTEDRTQNTDGKKSGLWTLIFTFYFPLARAAEWTGVDESVVEKYAEEYGRTAREPFINTDQGDLLLFVFLLAGAVGGFLAGYCWRRLTEPRTQNPE